MCVMGFRKFLCLVVVLSAFVVRGEEDSILDEEEEAKESVKEGTKEEGGMDWAEMFQMGMALGKSILGEEAVEKIKNGDLSELIKVGEKVLGEATIKEFLNSATEGAFAPKEGNEDEELHEDKEILEEDDEDEPTETRDAKEDKEIESTESTDNESIEETHASSNEEPSPQKLADEL
eukprot:GFUD01123578.1.p1 GENE.GFUD01123578.1~~GFUD01123578.1.p1  ORF type:complete len:177 (+),score=72.18 GFUD01123578.1:65-595(+)